MEELDRKSATVVSVSIDGLANAYERFRRSLRLLRALTAGIFFEALSFMLLLCFVILTKDPLRSNTLVADKGVRIVILIIVSYVLFYIFRTVTNGSVNAVRVILGICGIILVLKISATIVFSFLYFIEIDRDSWFKYGFLVQAISELPISIVLYLIIIGLTYYLRYSTTPYRVLFIDRIFSPRFFINAKDFLRNISKLMGVYSSSLYGSKGGEKELKALILAFALEGGAFSIYLTMGIMLVEFRNFIFEPESGYLFSTKNVVAVCGLLVIYIAPLILFIKYATPLRQFALRQWLVSYDELRLEDQRPPILFLRSFRDDQVRLQIPRKHHLVRTFDPGIHSETVEELILQNLDQLGPVITIGNPNDNVPPLGATRNYVIGNDWHEIVKSLMKESVVIIVGVERTAGLTWEIDTIRRYNLLRKTLFLLPPEKTKDENFLKYLLELVGVSYDPADKIITTHFHQNQKTDNQSGRGSSIGSHDEGPKNTIALTFPEESHGILLTSNRATPIEYELAIRSVLSGIQWNMASSVKS